VHIIAPSSIRCVIFQEIGFMRFRDLINASLAVGAVLTLGGTSPAQAQALSAKECHQKFKDAKESKTLSGQSYKEFKAAQCGAASTTATQASMTPSDRAAASSAPASTPPAQATPTSTAPATTAAPGAGIASKPTAIASGNVVFPGSIGAQYGKLSAGKARMKTCLDQYNANKTTGGNGSLKWIQKGGGYYSECNSKLKN